MKKLSLILLMVLIAGFVFAGGESEAAGTYDENSVAAKIVKGQSLSDSELLALAKQESGDFIAYGNSSRIKNAVTNFVKKYGAELGLTDANAAGTKMNDTEIFTTLFQESVGGSAKSASMVMIQDGAQLQIYRNNSNMFENYIPGAVAGKVAQNDLVPLVHQYINKLFIWNNLGNDVPEVKNVWKLTEPSMKGRVFFKNPTTEQVNMNFLIMCTSDEWAGKLAAAYKDYYGKDIDLGSYKNAGYKWVAEFLANCNFSISSDTTICQTMAKADSAGNIGLFVLSKFRDVDASIKGNLTVGAFTEDSVKPFAGFMYPLYAQITAKAPRPYTAMLFINYLMTEEGFAPWGGPGTKIMGAYSSSSDIGASEGDQPITFWKNCLVAEDANFIMVNKASVLDFVNAAISKK